MPDNLEKIFDFLHITEKLKRSFRYSAINYKIKDSSADHSWHLSLMVFIISRELKLKIDLEHALKIAIVHDIAESITGNIDYVLISTGKISKKQKQKMEVKAIEEIKKTLPPGIGKEVSGIWNEYKEARTSEAKFVKALSKIEAMVQILEAGHKIFNIPELIPTHADKSVENFPKLKPLLKTLKKRLKNEFKKGNFPWKKEYDNCGRNAEPQ